MLIDLNDNKYRSRGNGEDEKILHHNIAKNCKFGIVEIGVLNGDTTTILCEANKNIKIFGIDPIVPDSMNSNLIGNEQKILELEKSYNNFTFIKDYSYNAVKKFKNKFDYIFIDGDHNYEFVKKDVEDWLPKLEIGGYIALHDSAVNRGGPMWWGGPSKLSDELLYNENLEYIETVFTITLFRKK